MMNKCYEIEKIDVSNLDEQAVQHLFSLDCDIVEKCRFLPRFRNSSDYKNLYLSQFLVPDHELFVLKNGADISGIVNFVRAFDWAKVERYEITVRLVEDVVDEHLLDCLQLLLESKLALHAYVVLIAFNGELDELARKYGAKVNTRGNSYTLMKADIDVERLSEMISKCEIQNHDLRMVYTEGITDEYIEPYCDLFMETMKDMPDNQEAGYVPYVITPDEQRVLNEMDVKQNGSHHCYMIFDGDVMVAKTNVAVSNEDPRFPYQFMIGVLKSYRGRGLGKWLYACMYKRLVETVNFEQVLVHHHPNNQSAIALSEWMGYQFAYLEVKYILKKKKI